MKAIVRSIYKHSNDFTGDPQEYKGVKFYPVKVLDHDYVDLFYSLMLYPQRHIGDINIIKMAYIKFLVFVVFGKDMNKIYKNMKKFLSYVTKTNIDEIDILLKENSADITYFDIGIKIGDVVFEENEFDNVREIIIYQNGLSMEYINEFDPSLEENLAFMSRQNKTTFEDHIWSFCCVMGWSILQLKDYTLYMFRKQSRSLEAYINYKLFKSLEISGQISRKNGSGEIIPYYVVPTELGGRYDAIIVNPDKFLSDTGLNEDLSDNTDSPILNKKVNQN